MSEMPRLDQIRGCLLGLAVGDALGAPLEGLSLHQIRDHYSVVDDYVDGVKAWRRKPFRWRLAGLYSDDTQQALAVADELLASRRVDAARLARTYLDLANPRGTYAGAHRAIGRSFRQVLQELERGTCPTATGQSSAGAGAAVRIAAVALYHREPSDALFDDVLAAGLMTHRDIRSLAAAMAVAYALVRILQGEERRPSLLLRVAGDVRRAETRLVERLGDRLLGAPRHTHSISQVLASTEAVLDVPRPRGLVALVEQANRHGANPVCRRPTMGFAPALIPSCLYYFLSTDSFEESLIEILNLGGDTDTAGAVLGALAGASYGLSAIPARWLERLHNHAGILARADALAQRSTRGVVIPSFLDTERALCLLEAQNRELLIAQTHLPQGPDRNARRYFP